MDDLGGRGPWATFTLQPHDAPPAYSASPGVGNPVASNAYALRSGTADIGWYLSITPNHQLTATKHPVDAWKFIPIQNGMVVCSPRILTAESIFQLYQHKFYYLYAK